MRAPSERRGCGDASTPSSFRLLLLFVCLCLVDPAGGRLYEAGKSVVIFGELACDSLDFVSPGTGAAPCDCDTPVTGSVIYIEEGYVQGDLLSCPTCAALGLTVTFQAETGTLTIKGRASLDKHTQAIAGVEFRAASSTTDYRITYNYGHGTYSKDTGHFYDFFPISDGKCVGGCTWPDAQTACARRDNDLLGLIGYLVTVTTVEESAFAIKALRGQGWMGAADLTEGDWRWVTGPEGNMGASPCKAYDVTVDGPQRSSCDIYPLSRTTTPCLPTKECRNGVQVSKGFENWSTNEPNDWSNPCGGTCATTGEDFAHFYPQGLWNDYPYQSDAIEGYVCEWGGIGEMCIDPKHVHGTDKLVPECGSHKDENECKTELPIGVCEWDQAAMRCIPGYCRRHTAQAPCESDPSNNGPCMWSATDGCLPDPCVPLDSTACSQDTRCTPGATPGTCTPVACMKYSPADVCTAQPGDVCVWVSGDPHGCIQNPCVTYTTAATCNTDRTCSFDTTTGKCVQAICVRRHAQKLPCDADAHCMWVQDVTECIVDPCVDYNATACGTDARCLYATGTSTCEPTECVKKWSQQATCDADTSCMWSRDLVGCIANPCSGLDATQCALDTRCKTGPGSTCVTDKCMMHTQQAKCTADPADKCVWAGGVAPGCIDDPCANYTSTTCVTDATCKVDSTGNCVVDPCVVRHTQKTPCDADAACMWSTGTQQCIDNPCTGNTAQQTCTDDPFCDYDSTSMQCNPTTCAATHTQQSACDADTACMWSLDLVGCVTNPCSGLDATQCALDTRCKTGPGSTCVTDKCMMHTQQAKCTADPADKCVWAGGVAPGCIDDPCANYTSTSCVTDATCKVDSTGKCVVDPCVVRHTQKTPCDADTACMWSTGTQQCIDNPCTGNTAQQMCTDDPLCDYDSTSMQCNPTTCAATHTQQSACDADTACMWSLDLVGCIANPCSARLDSATCATLSSCLWVSNSSSCVTNPCYELAQQQCVSDLRCEVAASDSTCQPTRCFRSYDNSPACHGDAGCQWTGGLAACITEVCRGRAVADCKEDIRCAFDADKDTCTEVACMKNPQGTCGSAPTPCMWVADPSGCTANPCPAQTNATDCAADLRCTWLASSSRCEEAKTCMTAHATRSSCDADAACMWSVDERACQPDPCAALSEAAACAADPRCERRSGACTSVRCARRYTRATACDADAGCAWDADDTSACLPRALTCAAMAQLADACAGDLRCSWAPGTGCAEVGCAARHSASRATCDADAACAWRGDGVEGCVAAPCAGYVADADACAADKRCAFDGARCQGTSCAAKHITQPRCDDDASCLWGLDGRGCVEAPCRGLNTSACTADSRCRVDGASCTEATCYRAHTRRAQCGGDASCAWVAGGGGDDGCAKDPCTGRAAAACVEDVRCLSVGDACVPQRCFAAHSTERICNAAAGCEWVRAGADGHGCGPEPGVTVVATPCFGVSEEACKGDARCVYSDGSCAERECMARHKSEEPCNDDSECIWRTEPLGCVPDNGHFKFKKGVVVIGTVGMVFSGATGIGHAGSLTIATLSCFQHVEDKFTFLLHPTGIEVGDNLLAGAIVGNLAIIVGFTLVCRLLVACLYSPVALRATSCVSLHNDTQASLFFPSSALLIFQWLFQGLALAAMVLVVRLPAVWSGALGFTTLVVCMGVPVWVFRQLKSNVPRSACYINDDLQPRGRLLTILCGPGEWVSHYRKQHWVKRYAAVLLPFKQAIPWFSFWQFCQYLALCAVNAIRTENYVQCGHVKVAAALLFLGMLALLLITKPYTRPRDMAMLPLYMLVMAAGLIFEAASYYTYDPTGVLFDVATGFFVAALIILLIKMVLDLLTAVFILCTKRREKLQQEWWARKSGGDASLMLPDFPGEQEGGSFYEQPPAAAAPLHSPHPYSDPGDLGGLGTAVAPRSDEGALGGLGVAVDGSPDPTSDFDASADGGLGTYVPPQALPLHREGGGRGFPLEDAAPGSLGSLGVFVGPSEDTATSSAGPRSSSQHVSGSGGGGGGGAVLNPYDDDGAGGSESPRARESSQPFLQPSEVPRTSVRASSEGLEVAEWASYSNPRRSIAGLPSVSASDAGLRELSPRGRGGGGGGLQQHVI